MKTQGASQRPFKSMQGFLGFTKGYNVPLWLIFGGILFAFSLGNLGLYAVKSTFHETAAPGEYYWYRQGFYKAGLAIHLGTMLPAGLFAAFQFLPKIRQKFLIVHRINGYAIITFLLIGLPTGALITPRAFGGDLSIQTASYMTSLLTLSSALLAQYNIRKIQIDQHRKWMLRSMAYMSGVITTRILMITSAMFISRASAYYTVWTCEELLFLAKDKGSNFISQYPECLAPDVSPERAVPVIADYSGANRSWATVGSALRVTFGMAFWMGLALHGIAAEIYLHFTAAESERLRQVSWKRQVEAGMKNPHSAGTTSDRLGDENQEPLIKKTQ